MSTGRSTLATLPHDLQLKVASLLSLVDNRALCLVQRSWVDPCRSRLFRTIDTLTRTNANLGIFVEKLLPHVAPFIRRVRFSYTPIQGGLLSAAELDVWLLGRDEAFAAIVSAADRLRVATVILHYDSPYATSFVEATLDRLSLTRFANSLVGRDSLTCLKLDFGMPNNPYHLVQGLQYPILCLNLLTQARFPSLTHLSLASLTLPSTTEYLSWNPLAASVAISAFSGFLSSLPVLKSIQLDNVNCPAIVLEQHLPSAIHAVELLDNHRTHDLAAVLQALSSKRQLKHFRAVALARSYIPSGGSGTHVVRRTDAVVLANIETLVFEGADLKPGIPEDIVDVARTLLERLSAPQVRRLALPTTRSEAIVATSGAAILNAFPGLQRLECAMSTAKVGFSGLEAMQARSNSEGPESEPWRFSSAFKSLE